MNIINRLLNRVSSLTTANTVYGPEMAAHGLADGAGEQPPQQSSFVTLGSYAYSHKSLKWYQAVYHRIREIALCNGYILHKLDNAEKCLDAARFWKEVVDGLICEYVPTAQPMRGRPSSKPLPDRMTERHFAATYEDKTRLWSVQWSSKEASSPMRYILQTVQLANACHRLFREISYFERLSQLGWRLNVVATSFIYTVCTSNSNKCKQWPLYIAYWLDIFSSECNDLQKMYVFKSLSLFLNLAMFEI